MPIRIKNKRKVTPETSLKGAVKDWLNWNKWFHFPLMQGLASYPGLPDRIAIKKGFIFFIEVKSEKGKQSSHQRTFQANLENQHGNYILVRNLDDLIKWLGAI